MAAKKLFGTDGIRGVANVYPLTIDVCRRLAQSIVLKFCFRGQANGSGRSSVILGKDTRLSSDIFEHAMTAAFCSLGVDVHLLGVVPTPAVSVLVPQLHADFGVMISASHNEYFYNGIKLFNGDGHKLTDGEELELEEMMDEAGPDCASAITHQSLGKVYYDAGSISLYIQKIHDYFSSNLMYIMGLGRSDKKLRPLVDCANGSFSLIAPNVFRNFCDVCEPLFINASPNGININDQCGAACPLAMVSAVTKHGADLGIAFDGDGDRVILCDSSGKIMDGDHILAIFVESENLRNTEIVSTMMASRGLERYLESKNVKLTRTQVGDRYVSEQMRNCSGIISAPHSSVRFGGEPSGHIIVGDYAQTGDGLLTALKIIMYMLETGKSSVDLGKIFKAYPSVSVNVEVRDKSVIHEPLLAAKIAAAEQRVGKSGRLIVRSSGTEPVIRIMAEGRDQQELQNIVDELSVTISRLSCVDNPNLNKSP
jgi:phosphoglucosamine mutase